MEDLREISLGSTFRTTFINSGSTPSNIFYRVLTGSETMVSSYAGVSSGNGHYYADPRIDSQGLWKGQWVAVISANTYVAGQWLQVYPGDTDQPGKYVNWNDVVERYPTFADFGGAARIGSHYLSFAEAQIEGVLGQRFTLPFSSNNLTVKDLVIDLVYARAIRGKSDEYRFTVADIGSRVWALNNGQAGMITTSAEIIQPSNTYAWSNTQEFHPVFGLLDEELLLGPGSAELQSEANARGYRYS